LNLYEIKQNTCWVFALFSRRDDSPRRFNWIGEN